MSIGHSAYEQLTEKVSVGYFLSFGCQDKLITFSFHGSPPVNKQLLKHGGFGVKVDNNPLEYYKGYVPPNSANWIGFGRNHPYFEKAKNANNIWVVFFINGFRGEGIPYKVKFDLTGFSRELAKCSVIPDTN